MDYRLFFCPGVQSGRPGHETRSQTENQLRRAAKKKRAEGQEAWRKLLKHWHMRGAEVGK